MKTLKARTSHPKKQILKISDLTYNKHYTKYNEKLDQGVDRITSIMKHPIEVFKHKISKTPRMGVGGKTYIEKKFSVLKGSQRVTRAIELGYTHIEAVVYD
jgi:Leucine-rich repeat (LRR) protein